MNQVKSEKARRNFGEFIKQAWHVVEPSTPFVSNWHIDAIADHLMAVSRGEIHDLLINMPPRHMKSIEVSVMWPVWEWIDSPHIRWLFASYGAGLSVRDSVKSRRLIQSPWFQANFGDRFALTGDQNAKSRYDNDKTGYRIATSVGGAGTGEGGDRIVADDPHNVNEGESDPIREGTITWWDETMSTRGNDPVTAARVIVMQRVHAKDLSGHVLERGGYEHLCLPAEYERLRPVFVNGFQREEDPHLHPTSIGFVDPRTEEGELLWPARFTPVALEKLKLNLGSFGVAGQLQQRPAARSGSILKRGDWQYYKVLPELDEKIISVDCTFKDKLTSDYVAIQVWGRKGANKYLIHRIKERMGFAATTIAIRGVKALHPTAIAVLIEDKANGSAVIETLKQEISGVIPIEPEGGKVARAFAIQPEHEAGNLWLPDPSIDPTIESFVGTCADFPAVPNDDEVDSATQAINWYRNRTGQMGMFEYFRQQAAKQEKENGEKKDPNKHW